MTTRDAPPSAEPYNDLAVWDVTMAGQTCTVMSQNPADVPEACPHCGGELERHYIGCNAIAHYYVRSCPCSPTLVWNDSRYD
jgi:hypothetical protein